jgi:hypothetical protein
MQPIFPSLTYLEGSPFASSVQHCVKLRVLFQVSSATSRKGQIISCNTSCTAGNPPSLLPAAHIKVTFHDTALYLLIYSSAKFHVVLLLFLAPSSKTRTFSTSFVLNLLLFFSLSHTLTYLSPRSICLYPISILS